MRTFGSRIPDLLIAASAEAAGVVWRYDEDCSITDDGRLLRTAAYEEPSPFASLVGVGPQDKGDRLESFNVEQVLFHLQQEVSRQ